MSDKIRALIVEDHAALAENLLEFLGEERYVLDFAPNGLTALHLVSANQYDVIVLDVMLPGISGFDLCRRIRTDLRCVTPIIMMTAKDTIGDKETGFSRGADDYLVKPFDLKELALRMQALHRRARRLDETLIADRVRFDPGTLTVSLGTDAALELSGTAARIFEILMRAYPKFVSYEHLSELLWGDRAGDINTLRTHAYGLRKSLQEAFGTPLIKTLHGRGYRLQAPGEE